MLERRIRVMLIDDDRHNYIITRTLLSESGPDRFQLDWASSAEEGRAQLETCAHDVYLVDYKLGGDSGLDLIREATAAGCQAPLIMLTSRIDRELDLEAMRAGAADYLVKNQLDALRLERSIRYCLEKQSLVRDLDRERYLLHTLMHHLPDMIFFKDREYRFLRISKALADRLGLADPQQAVGRTDYDFFPEKYARRAAEDERRMMESGEPLVGKEEHPTWPDGSVSWVSTTKAPLWDRDDRVVGTFGIAHDISAQKEVEKVLRHTMQAAEAANRAKSQFLANMSHEIRTPMNAILGMTELVLDTELTDSQREYLSMVHASGESLLTLINSVLDFSKIEAGKLELESAPFDLRESLGDMMKSLALRAEREDLELACHVAPEVPETLVGDAARLRQIAVNLVGNAIKFTEQGEVVLDVAVEESSDEEALLHFTVKDTGIGIPADRLEKVFEAFEQVDSSTTRRYGGTGLGLAICSRLVQQMGGRIWAESEPGRGSTFHFTACFGVSQFRPSDLPQERSAAVGGTSVLVVDDNATNRRILDEMLRSWRMEPTLVSGAREALATLAAASDQYRPLKLVITDMNMPDMDGLGLVESMRVDPRFASLPVILLTSGGLSGDSRRLQSLEVSAHLLKPVKQSELFNAIAAALGVCQAEDARAAAGAAAHTLSPRRILLAEDSVVNQKLAIGLLERQGHTVVVASTGREVLDALQRQPFDAVLMDVQMPDMDGLQASRLIREREKTTGGGRLPIIAMTAHAMRGDRERCLAAGMDDYVSKPIRSRVLFEILDRHLADAPPVESATPPADTSAEGATPTPAAPSPTSDNGGVERGPAAAKQTTPTTAANSKPAGQSPPIDWQTALRSVGGDKELLRDVAGVFLSEAPTLLDQIRRALDEEKPADAQRAAHTLKSSLRTLGCPQAGELAWELEQSCTTAGVHALFQLLDRLQRAIDAISESLVAFTRGDDMLIEPPANPSPKGPDS
jgi:two-component system sensor histidine kinase/response regulator